MYQYKLALLPDSFNTDVFSDTPGALLHMALEDRSSFSTPLQDQYKKVLYKFPRY